MPSHTPLVLDADAIIAICAKYDLEVPVYHSRAEEGMVNDVFFIGDHVLKVNTGHPDQPKLLNEARAYELLRAHGVPSPEVVAVDDTLEILPHPYLIMERLTGTSLSVHHTSYIRDEMQVLEELGALLGRIHSIHLHTFGGLTEEGPESFRIFFEGYVAEVVYQLQRSEMLPARQIKAIRNFFKEDGLFAIDPRPSLVHGNFVLGNIVVDDECGVTGVVDWEWARGAHSQEELATFLYRVLHMDPGKCAAFLSGYEGVHEVGDDFDRRLLAYVFLYYLKVLPEVPKWTHQPGKQEEYKNETIELYRKVI
ncbi:MAG: aminoglycoside phosphotransferase family protein [bacterium]|nr:aminoglycoside phosphotransferase family protein [bacterium]